MVLAVPGAPAAEEDPECKKHKTAAPQKKLGKGPAPFVIGDSIMWWSVDPLSELGFRADAKVCRLWPDGRRMLKKLKDAGKLPKLVVMALGSNWEIPDYELDRTLPLVPKGHKMAIVTPRDEGGVEGDSARTVRRYARAYPKKFEVLDWVRYAKGKKRWFGPDGLHLTRSGIKAYTSCIKQAHPDYRDPDHPCAPSANAGAASCGGVKWSNAKRDVGRGKPPLVVGDSVMLLAVEPLAEAGFNVNARGCRMWTEGHAVLAKRKRQGRLPRLVVMALGANWSITREQIGRTRRLIGPRRVLALVTPRESGGGSGSDAANIRAAARAHPRNVALIDWVRFSRGHGGWFSGDGLHLSWEGVRAYVRCIRRALPYASGPRDAASGSGPRHPCASRP